VPGMPPARADILPAALVVICALADHTGAESIQLTHNGIRHGMANILLSEHGELLA
jgi:exopolyphosphatase/pppGpp-phosphohydrolase